VREKENELMEETIRNDIRKLLKTFGVRADQAILDYFENNPEVSGVKIRLVLEDLTTYPANPPATQLHLEVEGEVRRSE
jgi:hypothetical protein